MTPGSHPNKVRIKLIKNLPPRPCFKNTPNGGKRIVIKMFSTDIYFSFYS